MNRKARVVSVFVLATVIFAAVFVSLGRADEDIPAADVPPLPANVQYQVHLYRLNDEVIARVDTDRDGIPDHQLVGELESDSTVVVAERLSPATVDVGADGRYFAVHFTDGVTYSAQLEVDGVKGIRHSAQLSPGGPRRDPLQGLRWYQRPLNELTSSTYMYGTLTEGEMPKDRTCDLTSGGTASDTDCTKGGPGTSGGIKFSCVGIPGVPGETVELTACAAGYYPCGYCFGGVAHANCRRVKCP